MKKFQLAMTTAACVLLMALQAAQAGMVAITKFTIPAQSDVRVSLTVTRPGYTNLTVASKTASTLTPVEATGNAFAPTTATKYYVRFITGNAAGLWSTITADNGTLTLESTDVLGAVANVQAGDTFRVYKHHTIGTLFPEDLKDISFRTGTQILLFNNAAVSQNKSASIVVTRGPTSWLGGGGNNQIIAPDTLFNIRNANANPLTVAYSGDAPTHPISYLVTAGQTKDNLIGTGYPVTRTAVQTKLGTAPGRQILLFNNAATGINKSSSAVLTYSGAAWLGASGNATPIPAGDGFIFRQNGGAGGVVTLTKPYAFID